MGPGKDLDILAEYYTVTGSDSSQIFLDRYRKNHPGADLMILDAVKIETDRTFDCIYSNKVLQHLERQDLLKSFYRQLSALNKGGIAAHTLWHGEKEENFNGLRFIYYKISDLKQIIPKGFEIIRTDIYKETEEGDSIFLVLKKA
jgi:trans-aconitate methyltransferase